ncbi:fasciclin domain-containing protein [bacterium]|nr:fasciclin domain-containing protein [bacterium]
MNPIKKIVLGLFAVCLLGGVSATSFSTEQGDACHPQIQKGKLLDMARQSGKFTLLLKALEITGLDKELDKEGPVTLLAPTDEAFKRMSQEEIQALLKDKEYLTELLLHHVIEGAVRVNDAVAREVIVSMEGQELFFYRDEAGTFVNDSKIIMGDIEATNGIAHVIDTVLFPMK